MFLAVNHSVL